MRRTMRGLRHALVGPGETLLQFDRALHGIDRTGKFHQHAIAHHLDDAAIVLGDHREPARPAAAP